MNALKAPLLGTIALSFAFLSVSAGGPPSVPAAALATASPDRALALIRSTSHWPTVTYNRAEGIVSFKVDGSTHGWIVYDHNRPLTLHIELRDILLADPTVLLQLVGEPSPPRPTRRFEEGHSIHFEWGAGFGPFKKVSASTRPLGMNLPSGFVGTRVDINFVPESVLRRWESGS